MNKSYFFITGYPRSRTAWLANLCTWGDSFCLHDGFWDCADKPEKIVDKINSLPGKNVGCSDPCNVQFQHILQKAFPMAKWLIVHRNRQDAEKAASEAFGFPVNLGDYEAVLNAWNGSHFVYHISMSALEDEEMIYGLPGLLRHLNIDPMPVERIRQLMRLNVQVHPPLLKAALEQAA